MGAYGASGAAGPIILLGYRARIVAGELALTDHDAVAWAQPADLAAYPMPPADLPIVAALVGQA